MKGGAPATPPTEGYEGISGYEMFRCDLALIYLVELDATNGKLLALRMVVVPAAHTL